MSYTQRFSEVHQVLAYEPPDSFAAELNTGFLDIGDFHRVVVIVQVGDIAAGGQVTVNIQ